MPLFASFSTLGIHFAGSSGNGSSTKSNSSFISTYNVVYASPTTYKVNIDTNASGSPSNATAWVQKNGTVVAFSFSGQNLTGREASGIFFGYMFPFVLELQFNNYLGSFTTAAGVHQVGTATTTITGTTLSVTNYAASSLPLDITVCGSSFVLTAFILQTGMVQGVSLPLITQFHIAGTSTIGGQKSTDDFSFYIVSITKA